VSRTVRPKDYYLILGVSRSESPAGIRSRYRDLVRTLHPDIAGAQSTNAFQEITEAYEVLADPVARRRHNIELAAWERRPPVEPVTTSVASRRAEPVSAWPSFEALVERSRALTLEVILTPEEAARGVTVPIGVPATQRCPDCGGTGHVWLFPCVSCGERGVIPTERIVGITIPPRVRPGSVIEGLLGIPDVYLRLRVRIA
jgi:molecular chaperone DnaJ